MQSFQRSIPKPLILKEIDEECKIWNELPLYLEDATKDDCFVVSRRQVCKKPAYQIQEIDFGGNLFLSGIGSWCEVYGGYLPIKQMQECPL